MASGYDDQEVQYGNGKYGEIKPMFTAISNTMTMEHKRMDSIYTLSREITYESKVLITQLHRFQDRSTKKPPLSKEQKDKSWSEIMAKVESLRTGQFLQLFLLVKDATSPERHQYRNPISHGMQEFVEALAFLKFIQYQKLLRREEVQAVLTYATQDSEGQLGAPEIIPVTQNDFMLGIADLTGELMRTVPSLINNPTYDKTGREFFMKMLIMTQQLYQELQAVSPCPAELSKKLEVMRNNVMKMESALCGLRLREEELLANPGLLESFLMKQAQDIQE